MEREEYILVLKDSNKQSRITNLVLLIIRVSSVKIPVRDLLQNDKFTVNTRKTRTSLELCSIQVEKDLEEHYYSKYSTFQTDDK